MNVLPEQGMVQVRREYRLRLAAVALLLASLIVFLSVVFLLPSFFLSQSRVVAVAQQAELTERAVSLQEKDNVADELVATKVHLAVIHASASRPALSDTIRRIVEERGSSIRLTSISYGRIGGEGEMRLSGVADTRDALTALVRQLEREALFAEVDLPVSSFVKERDLSFVMRLEGDF